MHWYLFAAIPLALHTPSALSAAFDAFLFVPGIPGETEQRGHEKWIEIESFSFDASNPAVAGPSGAGAGKVQFQDFHVTKSVDKSSSLLMLATATGQHLGQAILDVVGPSTQQQAYLQYTLENVFVTSYSISGNSSGNSVPTDQCSLNFAKIEFAYRPQKADGTLDSPIQAGWDLKHATPAPEPSTWAMLAAGLAFVAFRGRRAMRARIG